MKEHLAKTNNLDLKKTKLTVGPKLNFDTKSERFVDNDVANKLLTRPARKGFVVPEKMA